jgi:hypothetical protein
MPCFPQQVLTLFYTDPAHAATPLARVGEPFSPYA